MLLKCPGGLQLCTRDCLQRNLLRVPFNAQSSANLACVSTQAYKRTRKHLPRAALSFTLQGVFVFDDKYAITGNPDVNGVDGVGWAEVLSRILLRHDFWGQDIAKADSHKSYRPLTTITFRLCHLFGGGR